ncbi:hypothetical protein [Actinokineospora globicatena]|nr:hypothetical protein [Actinokineospora globicatena]
MVAQSVTPVLSDRLTPNRQDCVSAPYCNKKPGALAPRCAATV